MKESTASITRQVYADPRGETEQGQGSDVRTKCLIDILRVEDNADDLAFFNVAVESSRLNIRLHTAVNVQQAIDYLEGKASDGDRSQDPVPDVVVLDLIMPGKSGFDFLAWRSQSGRFTSVPVVVFTGCDDKQAIQRAYAMGAGKCLTKPLSIEDWTAVMQEIWQLGGGAQGPNGTAA